MALGAQFVKLGLGLFIFVVVLVFGIIAHYIAGARYPTGDMFIHNITLWFACPWTLSIAVIQVGSLSMIALGLTHLYTARLSQRPASAEKSTPLFLCVAGLLGIFLVGYAGYFIFDAIWPSFYYTPVPEGKNAWLLAQTLCIVIYLAGVVIMFNAERRVLNTISAP